ncbi:MAG: SAM-dependent methyltransferase [Promethearchaeota archaeon]
MSNDPSFHKKDPQYKQAKKQGYRARSAYKLLEIQKRFNIFKRAFYILDIGSAPGSWLQVAREIAEINLEKYKDNFYHRNHYKIMGVDVKKISPIENVKIVKMDATNQRFQDEINAFFNNKLDLIISDASINKSGNKFTDQVRQINLCYKIFNDIVKKFLKKKGILVIKCFQGADFGRFAKHVKKEFFYVKTYKPKSSKKKSNEIFIIGINKR